MAQFELNSGFMELQMGPDVVLGNPPIRMMTDNNMIRVTDTEIQKPINTEGRLIYIATRLDLILCRLDDIERQLAQWNRPWYGRLWSWVKERIKINAR